MSEPEIGCVGDEPELSSKISSVDEIQLAVSQTVATSEGARGKTRIPSGVTTVSAGSAVSGLVRLRSSVVGPAVGRAQPAHGRFYNQAGDRSNLAVALTHFMRCCVVGVVRFLLMSHRLITPPRLVATALCCAMAVSAVEGAAVEQKRSYNLPSGDAATTLNQFAGASGQQIVFMMEKVKGERTNAVAGDYAAHDALDRMLAGTGLSATRDPATGAFVVSRKRTAESKPRTGEVGPVSDPQPKPTPKTQPMKSIRTLFAAFAGWLAASSAVEAQTTAAPAKEETIVLSPFTVVTAKDSGYRKLSSVTTSRICPFSIISCQLCTTALPRRAVRRSRRSANRARSWVKKA